MHKRYAKDRRCEFFKKRNVVVLHSDIISGEEKAYMASEQATTDSPISSRKDLVSPNNSSEMLNSQFAHLLVSLLKFRVKDALNSDSIVFESSNCRVCLLELMLVSLISK